MSKRGPIIIVEDDEDERDIILLAFQNLGVRNEVKFFDNGRLVLDYLTATTESPFIILCDINLPVMNGFELRSTIDKNETLRRKSIPFVFLSTHSNPQSVEMAYELTVQGFFVKENTMKAIEDLLKLVLDYWSVCKHPNN